ncbi:MAG: ABC transporter ATP-binding protein [Planctomyces sp.]|nr:ABC transporter ATP-binding protein [Planctomyces sp.]
MSSNIIEVQKLSRRFDGKFALNELSISIPRGGVFGLIGGNGAGKTTLIRHLLGLLRPESGTVRVFGMDPIRSTREVLGRVGYLSEDRDLPDWMRISELMSYTQAFYPAWDPIFAEQLRNDFDLNPKARVRTLSRGQRARAGLLIALAHRPDLLLLDEPSSGLDPVVRRDILGSIIRTVADEGRTVLFSSHLLDEVERVADQVAIIHHGRILLTGAMDEIRERHRRVTLRFRNEVSRPPELIGTIGFEGSGHEWTYLCSGEQSQLRYAAEALGAVIVEDSALTLDEIFVSRVLN